MAVKIRLKRLGRKKKAVYRIVVAPEQSPRNGSVIEEIGVYNPLLDPVGLDYKKDRLAYWLGVGAKPTRVIERLLTKAGDLDAVPHQSSNQGLSRKMVKEGKTLEDVKAEQEAAEKERAEKEAAEKAEKEAAEKEKAEKEAAEKAEKEAAETEAPAETAQSDAPEATENAEQEAAETEAPAETAQSDAPEAAEKEKAEKEAAEKAEKEAAETEAPAETAQSDAPEATEKAAETEVAE